MAERQILGKRLIRCIRCALWKKRMKQLSKYMDALSVAGLDLCKAMRDVMKAFDDFKKAAALTKIPKCKFKPIWKINKFKPIWKIK